MFNFILDMHKKMAGSLLCSDPLGRLKHSTRPQLDLWGRDPWVEKGNKGVIIGREKGERVKRQSLN